MLRLANETLDVIKGGCHLATATQVCEGKWIAHPRKGDHMVMFYYTNGILSLAMGESEYELEHSVQIIAYEEMLKIKPPTFKQILDLLNWSCDDYVC